MKRPSYAIKVCIFGPSSESRQAKNEDGNFQVMVSNGCVPSHVVFDQKRSAGIDCGVKFVHFPLVGSKRICKFSIEKKTEVRASVLDSLSTVQTVLQCLHCLHAVRLSVRVRVSYRRVLKKSSQKENINRARLLALSASNATYEALEQCAALYCLSFPRAYAQATRPPTTRFHCPSPP